MSRVALGVFVLCMLTPSAIAADGARDPHLDPSLLPEGCSSCHVGHGESDSPMMERSQKELCLGCHGDASSVGSAGLAAGRARTARIDRGPYAHPVDDRAFSRLEGRVTCTSCHSSHRGLSSRAEAVATGRKMAPGDETVYEHVMCAGCHGAAAGGFASPGSVADRISAANASYHPVEAPANGRSRSVRPDLAGREINCTDCHGSDAPGARGVHASGVAHILVRSYAALDGEAESEGAYALCYGCHDRESILRGDSFPEHRRHIVDERTSCSTCHDPHGSPRGRALTRLAGDEPGGRLLASTRTGVLAFDSPGSGSGACHVSCHGRDHGPEAYGSMALLTGGSPGAAPAWGGRPARPRPARPGMSGAPGSGVPPVRARDFVP